ncbi:MAG TPA: cytochrome c [Fibrobacteria bacterium]|nr:cytochrome c [Fibrobacteria bacterium]
MARSARPGSAAISPRRAFRGLGPAVLPAAFLLLVFAAVLELLSACNKSERAPRDPLVATGQAAYSLRCGSCHHPDPARDGSLGPAIKGASLELLKARVLHGTYPEGYTPKRSTKIMRKLPLTEADVEAIHAFLNKP